MSVLNKPQIEAYIGASGSGKGVSINARLVELCPPRLLIWDPRNEYAKQARPVSSLAVLVRDLKAAGPGAFRIRFVPGAAIKLDQAFDLVCKLALACGDLVFVAEELSDVTKASYAPPAWRRITTQGRHFGLHIMGAAQRPTLIDKTFLANCTRVRCFQLGYAADIATMAKELSAPVDLVAGLVTRDLAGRTKGADIRGLEYERRTRELWDVQIVVNARGATETRTLHVAATPKAGRSARATT